MVELNIAHKKHFELYLFGSALYSDNPSDIDLAIIYYKNFIRIQEAIQYRTALLKDLEKIQTFKIPNKLLSKKLLYNIVYANVATLTLIPSTLSSSCPQASSVAPVVITSSTNKICLLMSEALSCN